ncbi:universal stress protein [Paenibacillus nasutitermitis]|uniref:Universal stress protein UspA n=1 Tax=Paenibacillus nasutitermitis TaxID=1652958 RepID=A0A916ZGM1_9BACL|nr:universal stress protein [Paenibacillus nasutitermitis]GGD96605.1 universal stress protein UspA [Paenibacillus nasutitermitis]
MLFSHIIVAYDGSLSAVKALDTAIALVENKQAEKISIVHVYSVPYMAIADSIVTVPNSVQQEWLERAQSLLADAGKKTEQLPYANTVILEGSPAEAILQYADHNGGDLIVIGSRGLGGLREFMMGSVSHNIAQHAKIPVLIIK